MGQSSNILRAKTPIHAAPPDPLSWSNSNYENRGMLRRFVGMGRPCTSGCTERYSRGLFHSGQRHSVVA